VKTTKIKRLAIWIFQTASPSASGSAPEVGEPQAHIQTEQCTCNTAHAHKRHSSSLLPIDF